MTQGTFRLNIFHKLLLTLLAVTLIPLLTLWFVSNSAAQRELSDNVSTNLVSTMNTVATGINGWDFERHFAFKTFRNIR